MTLSIGVILGSTREGRQGEKVAKWLLGLARARPELAVELVDLKELALPFFTVGASPKVAEDTYENESARRWVATVRRLDGFIVVTAEYNHGYPAALKNALDYAYSGWNNKPIGFVSYGGSSGGVRAVQQLRQVSIELQLAPIREEVNIPFVFRAFDAGGAPTEAFHVRRAGLLLDQLAWWAQVLKDGRERHPLPGQAPAPAPRP